MTSNLLNVPQEFLRLFKAGKDAARAGDNQHAHEYFRRALEIDPYSEQTWLWLASVVDTDEDRRVCFENVLELNPTNPTAHRQLHKLKNHAPEVDLGVQYRHTTQLSRGRKLFRLILVLLIIVSLIVLLAVIITQ